MPQRTFRIVGNVLNLEGIGVPSLRVEAWDKDLFFDDFVGDAVTDSTGRFVIDLTEERYREWIFDRNPDLFFRVFSETEQVADTSDSVLWNREAGDRPVTIEVDMEVETEEPEGEPERFIVRGRLGDQGARPVPNARIRAFDKDLRTEQLLGETSTDKHGIYEVAFAREQFRRAEKKTADLIVRAFDAETGSLLLVQSDLVFNARPVEVIDLTVTRIISEYEGYLAQLEPLREGVPVPELTEEDVVFLHKETDIQAERIGFLVSASALGRKTGLPPAAFYGIARQGLPTVLADLLEEDVDTLRQALDAALAANIVPDSLHAQLDGILERLAELRSTDAGVQSRRERQKVQELGKLSGLDEDKAQALADKAGSPMLLDDRTLSQLVESGDLAEDEARDVGLSAGLYELLDRNMDLAAAFKTLDYPQLAGEGLRRLEDLAEVEPEDLPAVLDRINAAPPEGMSRADYARFLSKRVETLFPSKALWARMRRAEPEDMPRDIKTLYPLLAANDGVLKAERLEDLDLAGVEPELIEGLRAAHGRLRAFANSYPGLRLGEILEDSAISVPEKAKRVRERTGLLSLFREQNAQVEYLALDYSTRGTALKYLDFSGFSEDERGMLLQTLKAYQRIQTVTQDAVNTRLLLSKGHLSSVSIALASNRALATTTGLSLATVSQFRTQALSVATKMMLRMQGMVDLVFGGFPWLYVNNLGPSIQEYLKEIDGWETLFGNLDYCHCPHCRSVLSPAAYFVDLMRFVEQHILVAFEGHPDHALHLRTRRPDLWKLPLSCQNTSGLIPYLEIVNEVLENHIYLRLSNEPDALPSPGADRSAIEDEVYDLLGSSVGSFRQPFLLPLVRLQSYLEHFDITRGQVAQLVARTPGGLSYEPLNDEIAATVLGLSMHGGADDEPPYPHRDFELITTPISEIGGRLDDIYGLTFREEGGEVQFHDPALSPASDGYEESRNDVQPLLRAMGISRTELDAIINTRFVRFGAHPEENESGLGTRVISEKRDPIESIQPDIERIHGLTVEALDRMHRFVRLRRATPWSIGELDLLIIELDHREYCSGLEAETLQRLAELLQIQSRFGISVEDLVSLWSDLPCVGVDTTATPLICRLFEGSCDDCDGYALASEPFLHPALRTTPPSEPDAVLPRLLAGLKVDDARLYALITRLAGPLGIVDLESPDEEQRTFGLHRQNLSLIYRHARLAEWLGLPVPELFQLTELAGLSSATQVSNLDSLGTLIAFHTWWKDTNWSLGDLAFMTGGTPIHAADYPDAEAICDRMLRKVRDERLMLFGASLFGFLEGVTESQSRAITDENAHVFVPVPGLRYHLSEDFESETVATDIRIPEIPDEPISATQADVFGLLTAYWTPPDPDATHPKPSIPVFDDTLFAKLPDVTESQSRAIVAENADLIVPVPLQDVYWLAEDFDLETDIISIPAGIPVTEQDSSDLISRYHATEIIPSLLSAEFGMPVQKVKAMIALTGTNLVDAQFARALHASEPADSLVELVATLLRLQVLFRGANFDADVLSYFGKQPALFDAADLTDLSMRFIDLSVQTVRLVSLYPAISQAGDDSTDRREALHNRLRNYADTGGRFYSGSGDPPYADGGGRFYSDSGDHAAQAELATALGIEVGLAITAHEELYLPANGLEAMAKLMRCIELAGLLGVGVEILPRIVANHYPALDRAATALRSAMRTKYPDEAQWQDKIEPFDDRERALRRDALTDYLLHSISPRPFSSFNDLYHYFLIDVELDGCARTSRIVAANSSAQLYVHRALMNLEMDRAEVIAIELDDEAVDEWEWRKNYRVWEANRKVFLYPENYIEPDLRDNKTPLFEELESTLLQQEINEDNVLEAYSSYMRGFDEVARLSIAGSYHDLYAGREHDVLHLFGVSQGDSFSYYYRTIENLYHSECGDTRDRCGIVWNPWRKVDVQIPVRKASPIVFNGRLYLFWLEINSKPLNSDFEGGSSFFTGYEHNMSLKFTKLMLDGSWSTPVKLKLDSGPFDKGDGVVEDLIDPLSHFRLSTEDSQGNKHYMALPPYGTENDWHITDKTYQEIDDDVSTAADKENKAREDAGTGRLTNWEIPGPWHLRFSKLKPKDNYTLKGYQWERVYPDSWESENVIVITGCNFRMKSRIDFYRSAIGRQFRSGFDIFGRILGWKREDNVLYNGLTPDSLRGWLTPYAFASVLVDQRNTDYYGGLDFALRGTDFYPGAGPGAWGTEEYAVANNVYRYPVARNLDSAAEISVVNGSYVHDGILDTEGDLLYFQQSPAGPTPAGLTLDYLVRRIGTTLSDEAASILFSGGVDALLSLDIQEALQEASLPVDLEPDCFVIDKANAGKLDFEGPFGVYFWEIFFHIPFLIANHLNGSQKFAEAQKWYHYIFNPTAKPTGTEDEPTDRNWRYVEFRRLDPMKLRTQLTHSMSIETYKRDPSNPHAIARLRLSAYQKAIVMKYVDNLLDWGDHLFSQDTMESINEATLLYVLASDILGERPEQIGECDSATGFSMNYEEIAEGQIGDSEFLMEMSHISGGGEADRQGERGKYAVSPVAVQHANERVSRFFDKGPLAHTNEISPVANASMRMAAVRNPRAEHYRFASFTNVVGNLLPGFRASGVAQASGQVMGDILKWYLLHFSSRRPVFCIPPNETLLGYWDRVEDRLHKIRHCMNMSGVRREISLFAPEIDPMLLVRAKAASITIDEVLSSIRGSLPPYRFSYIIERAKGYAATLQGFGAALLSALEKKDVEELSQIRAVQQQNVLKKTSQIKQWELDAADEAHQAVLKRQETISYRRTYYQDLVSDGLSDSERLQQATRRTATAWRLAAGALDILAGISHLIPELGSPFALKFGGRQLGDSSGSWSKYFRIWAEMNDAIAAQAGLEAGFARRNQGWEYQVELARRELEEIEKQIEVAKIRIDIAKRSKEVHEQAVEQQEEIYDFFQDKFSNLGLYTWLSTTLQRLYRDAYNNAYAMAKLAEQAYRFERGDDAAELIGASHWDASKAGLMAGESLLIDLQNLERRFLETNYRSLEIDQSFSLTQIAPKALLALKESGECEFEVPEVFFDIYYPGHYRRRIKAARLTIPCITGPYTNVSATLRLLGSQIRNEPELGERHLVDVPVSRTTTIATSTAQNDAGVFELNFRDERYMPFEGAGAVSRWQLSLPRSFKPFDYQTINDVILHISYTAEENETLRGLVESQNDDLQESIRGVLANHSLLRVVSVRQELSNELHRLLHSAPGTTVEIEFSHRYFPFFLKGEDLDIQGLHVVLRALPGQPEGGSTEPPPPPWQGVSISLRNPDVPETTSTGITLDVFDVLTAAHDFGGLPYASVVESTITELFPEGIGTQETISLLFSINAAGNLAPNPESLVPPDVSAIDSDKLPDIYLVLEYRLRG